MNPGRRRWLLCGLQGLQGSALASLLAGRSTQAAQATAGMADPVRRGRPLQFPRDHGAHLGQRTEWWYATGWLQAGSGAPPAAPTVADTALLGFQLTFFRSRTGLPGLEENRSRFAPRQLLFAHVAVTDLAGRRHLHDQRILRWSEAEDAPTGAAAVADARVWVGDWLLQREPAWPAGAWRASLPARGFGMALALAPSQPLLLQGDAGFSRKGPEASQASHYYSLPQLLASGQLQLDGRPLPVQGRAWLDHEWSDEILHPEALGWDWIGMNLFDGSALTAFQLRRADGSALWAGGSFRRADETSPQNFEPDQLQWRSGRRWRSPDSAASYPVEWNLSTPAGRFSVRALADAQELDSRGSTGAIYWEGLSELLDAQGRRVGLGYLEMTGYAGALRLG